MKKKLPVILIILLVLVLAGAGGFLFLRTQEGQESHVALTSVVVTGKRAVTSAEDPDYAYGKYFIRFNSPSFSPKAGEAKEWEMPLHADAEILYDAIFTNKDYMLFQVLVTVPKKDLKELAVIGNDGYLDPYKILSDPALVKKYARIVSVQAE